MRIIPAIDIIDGKCVRLSKGDYAQKKIYNENPLEVARTFEDAGLKDLHLVDLDGAKAGAVTNWEVIKSITTQTQLNVDFGGGIKKEEEIYKLLDLGVKQINLGSIAMKNPDLVYQWIKTFGSEKIILSADVSDEVVHISGWQENTSVHIEDVIRNFHFHGIQYVACTDIQTDGMLSGPNITLYKKLKGLFPEVKIIASGGVSSIDDVNELRKNSIYAVIIGKAIYENKIDLSELIEN